MIPIRRKKRVSLYTRINYMLPFAIKLDARTRVERSKWSCQALGDAYHEADEIKPVVDIVDQPRWNALFFDMPFTFEQPTIVIKQTPIPPMEITTKDQLSKWYENAQPVMCSVAREARMLYRAQGPNVCKMFSTLSFDWKIELADSEPFYIPSVCLVLKHYEGRDLYHAAFSGEGSVSPKTLWKWAKDLAQGLEWIHSKGILHRDVKPENILVDGDQVVLSDFGLSHDETSDRRKTFCGTVCYLAPELAQLDDKFESFAADLLRRVSPAKPLSLDTYKCLVKEASRASDMYALGITLYSVQTLSSLASPFDKDIIAYMGTQMHFYTYMNYSSSKIDPAMFDMIKRLLAFHPYNRPAAGDVVYQAKLFE